MTLCRPLAPPRAKQRRTKEPAECRFLSREAGNLVKRNFHADAPDALWLTDMTEFALPSGKKVYLNPVINAFDGAPVSWRIGTRPTKELLIGDEDIQ